MEGLRVDQATSSHTWITHILILEVTLYLVISYLLFTLCYTQCLHLAFLTSLETQVPLPLTL